MAFWRYSLLVLGFCIHASVGSEEGPCRSWFSSCDNHEMERWKCGTVEDYIYYTMRGCPTHTQKDSEDQLPPKIPPPPGRCLMVDDVCQFDFTSSLQCAFRRTQSTFCQYKCVAVNGSSDKEENCSYSRYPPPDTLCVPMDGQCREYNPCKYWEGWCLPDYVCGTIDDYYRFKFGPQPRCARPPAGLFDSNPPGECIFQNNTCSWSDCKGHLDFCQFNWMCGSAYDAAVYYAGPPPPCPPPPPNSTHPPPPGECVFNLTADKCKFTGKGDYLNSD